MTSHHSLALFGATGALGREILSVLEERGLELGDVRLYASPFSEGEELLVGSRVVRVKALPDGPIPPTDIAILALPEAVKAAALNRILAAATAVIDIAPVVEGTSPRPFIPKLGDPPSSDQPARHLASPSDTTLPLALVLKPLHQAFGLNRLSITSLEPASGVGQRGMETLSSQTLGLYRKGEVGGGDVDDEEVQSPFPHQLSFNALPAVGAFDSGGHAQGEADVIRDLPLLLGAELPVAITCIRVPWFSSHGITVVADFDSEVDVADARQRLAAALGVEVVDNPTEGEYPMPFSAVGQDDVFVGRLRQTRGQPRSLSLWLCADNLRVGGAINVVDIVDWLLASPDRMSRR